ncbi:efflux RND transporter permease subunit [Planctomicrobium piriforme]|uniref:Hydrophobic/amphiphilic exporter-1, HAE1 family n=1 Tax=Planctomicrobium piriforme TaxID=1576369 RepID=A0A1I3FY24_9PLAN|nr:efflux RND transporter permease subunit [Planctomicrobium piriforme]SFI16085.1 hydrophobic/amphiphilic exporter-1, HAE1 family [Planctomicrobium piriforme]
MNIAEICIRRPVFTWVLVAIPAVLGMVAYTELGVDLFPKVEFPVASITATLPGASAEEIETTVTKPLEEAINTVSGLDEIQSTSREGASTIIVRFVLEKDIDVAVQEVRDKVSSILKQLPDDIETPVVNKFDLDASPIMTLGVAGRRDEREVTELTKRKIQEVLQTVPGVGSIFLTGGRSRAVNVILDLDRLSALDISVEEVRQALVSQNMELPGGIVDQGPRELVLRTLGRIRETRLFSELIVTNRNGYPIRIKDIGRAEDSIEIPRGLSTLDGENAASLFILKQSGTNTVAISNAVKKRLDKIRKTLPEDIKIEIIQDQAQFIQESMDEVQFHLLLAAVLVSGTILLFIRDWRTTLIATLAIPTSIVPTFLFMQYMDFSLNNITMLALILAIGVVIDDAVVVHENIFRYMEEHGLDAMAAARRGTSEIALAVLATSLSLVVIFVPVAFMGGIVGRFFSSFGLTVAMAILISLFVSFTLTPMLCSRFLKLDHSAGGQSSKSGFIYRFIDHIYGIALRFALKHRFLTMGVCVLVMFSTIPIAMTMGVNMVPRDDQSEFQVSVLTPEGYTLQRTTEVIQEIERRVTALPGVTHRFTVVGESNGGGKGQGDVTRASIHVSIIPLEERRYSQFDIMKRARRILEDYPELRTAVMDVSTIGGGANGDSRIFQMSLRGPDLEKLATYSETLATELRKIPGLVDVDTTLSLRKPELQVEIDRDRASDLGIPVQTISSSLNVLVGGQIVSKYQEGSEQYDVWLRADKPFRNNPENLDYLTIPSPKAGLVQLTSLARLSEARGPSQIDRLNRQRTVTVRANPEAVTLNEAVDRANAIIKEMNMPPEYEVSYGGQAEMLGETAYYFGIALFLSTLFMYLILAAQFESWLHPISILAALPVTIPFGLLSLLLFRTPMDLYAMFGLFMLIGIVKKNGILQIDKTNELRRAGMERDAAILEANHTRLRPILMTTVMLVAAMAPIAVGQGPGAGARASMAKVIIGGQLLSLLLALLVTPVTYSLIDSLGNVFSRRRVERPAPVESQREPTLV